MPPTPVPIRIDETIVYALPLAAGGWLMIDAGPDTMGSWGELQGRIASRGFDTDEVRAVLITHAHIDHAGLAARWAATGAIILAGAADVPALLAGKAYGDERLPHRLDTLRRHGAPDEVLAIYEASQARRGYGWEPCPVERVAPIVDGTRIPLAAMEGEAEGTQLRVIHTPGHTPGSLVALVEADGDLYTGDTLIPHQVPTPGLHFPQAPDGSIGPRWPSLPPFLRSVARLREVGARRTLQAHGQPGASVTRLVGRFEAHHARRGARYRELLAHGPDTVYGIAERAFPHINPLQLTQAMVEILGHLDLWQGTGLVERDETTDGVVRFRLV